MLALKNVNYNARNRMIKRWRHLGSLASSTFLTWACSLAVSHCADGAAGLALSGLMGLAVV